MVTKSLRPGMRLGLIASLCGIATVFPNTLFAQEPAASVSCPGLVALQNSSADASDTLQRCIDNAADGMRLELKPGAVYSLQQPVHIRNKSITIATAGMDSSSEGCGSGVKSKCASFYRAPGFQSEEGPNGPLFRATGNGVAFSNIVISGLAELFASTAKSCSRGALVQLAKCDGCSLSHVSLRENLCGAALSISDSSAVTVSDSAFEDNGSALALSDGINVTSSKRVSIEGNFFINSSKFDINSRSCDDCSAVGNIAWHPRPSDAVAVAAFRFVAGNTKVTRNLVDCDGTGCNAGFIFGSTAESPKPARGEMTVSDNVSLNAPTGFLFGRGVNISLDKNFSEGGERTCGKKRFYSFTRLSGAELSYSGSSPEPGQVMEGSFSPRVMPRKELATCLPGKTTSGKLPRLRASQAAIANTATKSVKRELLRDPFVQRARHTERPSCRRGRYDPTAYRKGPRPSGT